MPPLDWTISLHKGGRSVSPGAIYLRRQGGIHVIFPCRGRRGRTFPPSPLQVFQMNEGARKSLGADRMSRELLAAYEEAALRTA